MADTIAADLGGLHGIVQCAAQFAGLQPASADDPLDWLRNLHVNLTRAVAADAGLPAAAGQGRRQRRSCSCSTIWTRRPGVLGHLRRGQACARRPGVDPPPGTRGRSAARACAAAAADAHRAAATAYFGENSLQLPCAGSDRRRGGLSARSAKALRRAARCWICSARAEGRGLERAHQSCGMRIKSIIFHSACGGAFVDYSMTTLSAGILLFLIMDPLGNIPCS